MAKRVWLLRHAQQQLPPTTSRPSWHPELKLAPGADRRVEVAAMYFHRLEVYPYCFSHSNLLRSIQTAQRLREKMDLEPFSHLAHMPLLGPGETDEWERCWTEWAQTQPDPSNLPPLRAAEMVRLWPDLCEREGQRVLKGVHRIARDLPDGENAVAVSHNPLIRLARWQADSQLDGLPDLDYCQAVEFAFGYNTIRCEEHLF